MSETIEHEDGSKTFKSGKTFTPATEAQVELLLRLGKVQQVGHLPGTTYLEQRNNQISKFRASKLIEELMAKSKSEKTKNQSSPAAQVRFAKQGDRWGVVGPEHLVVAGETVQVLTKSGSVKTAIVDFLDDEVRSDGKVFGFTVDGCQSCGKRTSFLRQVTDMSGIPGWCCSQCDDGMVSFF